MDTKKKKIQMPGALRSKLMAAIAMLLVASVMMVSAAYAWFTLSTAPEVTGITTSVGANGNLEIALLTTDTYNGDAEIQSNVGSSIATTNDAKVSNITWGNLVDLSDASYGLSTISLNQSQANINEGVLNPSNPLKTAVYGADGRVASVGGTMVSAVKDTSEGGTNAFTYTSGSQTYGVRAVGEASNLSARQIAFNGAKSAVTSNQSNAKNATKNAISGASSTFIALALAGNSETTSYTSAQVSALKDIAVGMSSSLNSIVLVYANAGLATAASGSTATDDAIEILKNAISGNAAAMKTALNTAGVTAYDSILNEIATAQTAVQGVITGTTAILEDTTKTSPYSGEDATAIKGYVMDLVGDDYTALDANDAPITTGKDDVLASGRKVYLEGTTTTESVATKKALAVITGYAGNFKVADVLQLEVFAGASDATATWPDVSGLAAPAGAAESNIVDTYGYILDFAFRTNAADSVLQLQTTAVNRVYSDAVDANLATQGSGSNVSFTYTDALSTEQAETLLENIKLVFFDTTAGTVFAQGKLTSIAAASGSATANITLDKTNPAEGEADDIVALNQNEIKFVSILVYLDGETITNADVANAATSGTLNFNFQFSSSATLVPMENTNLRNMTNS